MISRRVIKGAEEEEEFTVDKRDGRKMYADYLSCVNRCLSSEAGGWRGTKRLSRRFIPRNV